MSQKLNKKEIRAFVKSERNIGKTDKEIYEGLKANHSDKKAIAKLIAGTAKKEAIEKHKWIAHLLSLILLLGCVFYCYMAWLEFNPIITKTFDFWIRAALFSTFTVTFIYLIYQFIVEEVSSFFMAFFWVFFYTRLARTAAPPENVIAIGILIIVLILAVIYNQKMFPKCGISGVKKDMDGEYIL